MHFDNPTLGIVDVRYNSCTVCPGDYSHVLLNYYAGVERLTRRLETAIVRLAHSKMPQELCGCEIFRRMWMRDHEVPKILTQERVNCPFGMSDGAWTAWKWACDMELKRITPLTGRYR
jgi:hypothetical protein